jgi:hypothetical protein
MEEGMQSDNISAAKPYRLSGPRELPSPEGDSF